MARKRKSLGAYEPKLLARQWVGVKKCERWTDNTKICIEGKKYGFAINLVNASGGKLPISAGDARSPAQAMEGAKKFLRTIHGKNN